MRVIEKRAFDAPPRHSPPVEVVSMRYSLAHLTDGTLLQNLHSLVAKDRSNTADLLAHIAEVDQRRLYAPAGYPSMKTYCLGELHLSEDAASKRIQAARIARR